MMKLWSCLCFLVLVISSTSRGQGQNESLQVTRERFPTPPASYTQSPNGAENNPTNPTLASTPSESPTSTDSLPTEDVTESLSRTTKEDITEASAGAGTGAGDGVGVEDSSMTVSTSTPTTSSKPDARSFSWGSVILALIIVLIVALCVILYCLRRVSRSYSFDLQRPDPIISQLNEPTGTFEQVYLDDLDQPAPKDPVTTSDLSLPPVSNGTNLQSEEKVSNGENDLQEKPDANGLEASPISSTSHTSGDDPADKTSNSPSSTDLFLDGRSPQNENNNNPSVFASDPFVEINLEDPEWCDHLLTSPEATSSVLPFSPFSFSSSSSSS